MGADRPGQRSRPHTTYRMRTTVHISKHAICPSARVVCVEVEATWAEPSFPWTGFRFSVRSISIISRDRKQRPFPVIICRSRPPLAWQGLGSSPLRSPSLLVATENCVSLVGVLLPAASVTLEANVRIGLHTAWSGARCCRRPGWQETVCLCKAALLANIIGATVMPASASSPFPRLTRPHNRLFLALRIGKSPLSDPIRI